MALDNQRAWQGVEVNPGLDLLHIFKAHAVYRAVPVYPAHADSGFKWFGVMVGVRAAAADHPGLAIF